jgi:hypothetical protein
MGRTCYFAYVIVSELQIFREPSYCAMPEIAVRIAAGSRARVKITNKRAQCREV